MTSPELFATLTSYDVDAALDALYDHVDRMLLAGDFAGVARLLATVPIAIMRPSILVGFLTIVPDFAPVEGRAKFAAKVRAHLLTTMPPERVDDLLRGLE